jgi:hypothetical protein
VFPGIEGIRSHSHIGCHGNAETFGVEQVLRQGEGDGYESFGVGREAPSDPVPIGD